jgi:hypothetical protein
MPGDSRRTKCLAYLQSIQGYVLMRETETTLPKSHWMGLPNSLFGEEMVHVG